MYAKLNGSSLQMAPKRVTYEGHIIFNPCADVLSALGYKPVVYTDPPEAVEGMIPVSTWEETETEIVQVWKEEKIPEPPADATDRLDEIIRILSGAE